jgi:hypothetical protein
VVVVVDVVVVDVVDSVVSGIVALLPTTLELLDSDIDCWDAVKVSALPAMTDGGN